MKSRGDTKIPEFQSLEEEREYWEAHGPLAEGHKGRISKPQLGQKRSSFLSIRMTGEELTQLQDMAAKFGTGPSTYARQVLRLAIEQKNWPSFLPPSFLLPPLYDSTSKRAIKPCDEFLGRAENAYAAYFKAQKEVLEVLEEAFRRIYQEDELSVGKKT